VFRLNLLKLNQFVLVKIISSFREPHKSDEIIKNHRQSCSCADSFHIRNTRLDSLEGLADSLSEECLEKLHVIQSRS